MKSIDKIASWYRDRFKKHGLKEPSASVGFDVAERQMLRWKVLLEARPGFKNLSILDAGCGLAGLYDYISTEHGFTGSYTGYDLLPEFIDHLCKKHPNGKFEVKNVYQESPSGTFDLIVASGLFTLNIENQWENIEEFMKRMFNGLNNDGALALNLFTSYVNFREHEFGYYEPEKIYSIAKKITPYVTLRSDYLPFDFSVYLYKKS